MMIWEQQTANWEDTVMESQGTSASTPRLTRFIFISGNLALALVHFGAAIPNKHVFFNVIYMILVF